MNTQDKEKDYALSEEEKAKILQINSISYGDGYDYINQLLKERRESGYSHGWSDRADLVPGQIEKAYKEGYEKGKEEVIEIIRQFDYETEEQMCYKNDLVKTMVFKLNTPRNNIEPYKVIGGDGEWLFKGSHIECFRFIENCKQNKYLVKSKVKQYKLVPNQ